MERVVLYTKLTQTRKRVMHHKPSVCQHLGSGQKKALTYTMHTSSLVAGLLTKKLTRNGTRIQPKKK